MNASPFYLVWNPNGYPPRYKHDTYQSAQTEAVRLARESPGHRFYVLAVVGEAIRNDVTITQYDPNLPF